MHQIAKIYARSESMQQGIGIWNLAWLIVVAQEPFPFPSLAPHKGVEYLSLTWQMVVAWTCEDVEDDLQMHQIAKIYTRS